MSFLPKALVSLEQRCQKSTLSTGADPHRLGRRTTAMRIPDPPIALARLASAIGRRPPATTLSRRAGNTRRSRFALGRRRSLACRAFHAPLVRLGTLYLRIVGPAYVCFGLGLALFYVTQSVGRGVAAMNANAVRMMTSAGWARRHLFVRPRRCRLLCRRCRRLLRVRRAPRARSVRREGNPTPYLRRVPNWARRLDDSRGR